MATYRNVLGCLMKNPKLFISYSDIVTDDFIPKVTKIIFANINNLYRKTGIIKMEPIDVDLEIEKHEGSAAIYKAENGLDFLKACYELADESAFDYYYHRLKKLTLIKTLIKKKYDVSYYFRDSKDFNTIREEDETIERFEEATIEDILNYVEGNYNKIREEFLKGNKNNSNASEGIVELIEEFKKTPEVGPDLEGMIFSSSTRGARAGKFYLRSAASGLGKALTNTTKIPMADGSWKMVGEVEVGDLLVGLNGKPTRVLMVHPQKEKKQVYEVIFKDGRKVECCEDHLWTYYYCSHREQKIRTSSTKELYNDRLQYKDGTNKYKIPLPKPIEYEEKRLSPSPYVMGLLLGDGSFRYVPTQKSLTFSSESEELPNIIAEELNCYARRSSEKNFNWTFQFNEKKSNRKNIWVEEVLSSYPGLWNKKSEDKYIPEDYLKGSVKQRMELLKGLLDTDGSIDEKGRINFCNTSYKMIKQIQELCWSLGFITSIGEDKREKKYTTGKCYNLHILCDKKEKVNLFGLSRKKEKAERYLNNEKRQERCDWLPIVEIIKTDRYEDMTCFTVDAEDSLFLCGDYITTHNTRLAVFDACKIAYPIHYDLNKECFIREVNSKGEFREARKTLLITTEMDKSEIQTIMVAYLSKVNEENILKGCCSREEAERIAYACKIMEEYKDYFFLEEISDPNLTNVEALIKRYATIENVKYVFFDYIFTSPSLIAQFSSAKLREDVCLGMLANQLKQLAKDYNIFISSSTQLNSEGMNKAGFKDEKCLRGAKSLADKLDVGCCVSRVIDEEYNSMSAILRQAGLDGTISNQSLKRKPNLIFDIYKNRRGKFRGIRIWSYVDLGTGEREDLYMTNQDNTPIENVRDLPDNFIADNGIRIENWKDEL